MPTETSIASFLPMLSYSFRFHKFKGTISKYDTSFGSQQLILFFIWLVPV
jgi:hypothetical protein